jgi:hypothetical protein
MKAARKAGAFHIDLPSLEFMFGANCDYATGPYIEYRVALGRFACKPFIISAAQRQLTPEGLYLTSLKSLVFDIFPFTGSWSRFHGRLAQTLYAK